MAQYRLLHSTAELAGTQPNDWLPTEPLGQVTKAHRRFSGPDLQSVTIKPALVMACPSP